MESIVAKGISIIYLHGFMGSASGPTANIFIKKIN
jgi:hypothetical protein